MIILSTAPLIWAAIDTVLFAVLQYLSTTKLGKNLPCTFAFFFLANLWAIYFMMPVQVGFLWGQGEMIFLNIVFASILAVFLLLIQDENAKHKKSSAAVALLLACIFALLIESGLWGLTYLQGTFGADRALDWATLAHVTVASNEESLPQTDTQNIVQVNPDIAQFLGSQKLGSTGGNLGSLFQIRLEDWVLQSVQGHLYYIAPLSFHNGYQQLGWFAQKTECTPGFMVVDAENSNQEARLVLSPIKYLPSALFNNRLERHAYGRGFTYTDKFTFEVDEDWHPYWTTVSLRQRFQVAGDMINQVLVIDAFTGDITPYGQDYTPDWIDRVLSESLVTSYLKQWGYWFDSNSRNLWPNWTGQYQSAPTSPEFVFNKKDQPTWLIPVTSLQSSNPSSTGVVLYDTRDNHGVFYPGLDGLAVGNTITSVFQNSPENLRGYMVDSVQLYSIHGVPTWFCIFVQSQGEHGSSLAAVGLVDAKHASGANVIMAPNLDSALNRYYHYLASGALSKSEIAELGITKSSKGKISDIGVSVQNGESVYFFTLEGDSHLFTATLKVNHSLPLLKTGQDVSLSYIDTNSEEESVSTLSLNSKS